MPTKVSVGLSKKAGLPNYGSLGASCHVELELDGQILAAEPERFRDQVRRAYAACRSAVEDELTRDSQVAASNDIPSISHDTNGHSSEERANRPYRGKVRTATPGQVSTIHGMAARLRVGLGPLLARYQVQAANELSVFDASQLISELQQHSATGSVA